MNVELGNQILSILVERRDKPTYVYLEDEGPLYVNDIDHGYDMGDEFAHITTNMSGAEPSIPSNFFYTNEVIKIVDYKTMETIFEYGQDYT